jgi:hypothetical protein
MRTDDLVVPGGIHGFKIVFLAETIELSEQRSRELSRNRHQIYAKSSHVLA